MDFFFSDNTSGIAPQILQAIERANEGGAPAYGTDSLSRQLVLRMEEVFGCPVEVFLVNTGIAANSLALSAITPPAGAVICHEYSHINECKAPQFYGRGARLSAIGKSITKLSGRLLDSYLKRTGQSQQPKSVSISQLNELGITYSPDEVAAISRVTKKYRMRLHMDGARFANAVASLACSPSDVTWKSGVDVLSFGATKNGAMAAEAVVFFNRALARNFPSRQKRGGHVFSKNRFIAAQMLAYLSDDLWLSLARHANGMARYLSESLCATFGDVLLLPTQGNQVFVSLPRRVVESASMAGAAFQLWNTPGLSTSQAAVRFVTSFSTTREEIDLLRQVLINCTRRPIEEELKTDPPLHARLKTTTAE